jgi:hypothetical protein
MHVGNAKGWPALTKVDVARPVDVDAVLVEDGLQVSVRRWADSGAVLGLCPRLLLAHSLLLLRPARAVLVMALVLALLARKPRLVAQRPRARVGGLVRAEGRHVQVHREVAHRDDPGRGRAVHRGQVLLQPCARHPRLSAREELRPAPPNDRKRRR